MKFYLTALICLLTFKTTAQVNIQDSLALVDLYNSTNGKAWAFNANWLSKEPVYKWWGVDVDPFTGTRVFIIDLHDNMLSGSIPESIGNLTALAYLGFPNNNLSGSLPESIGNLKNLQTLKLWHNQIAGPLPSSIGNLKNLVYLLLNNNKLNGAIPTSIGGMSSLQDLELFSNQLSDSIPSSIGNLPNLIWMKLHSNKLTGLIPQSIGNLKKLTYLDLSNNQLSGNIPSSLAQPPGLDYFNVSNNKLMGALPVEIMKHSTIGQINTSYNQLTGTIPTEIGSAQNLVTLDLSNNQLSGNIPSTIGNLYHLHIVNLSNNFLNGVIPSGLGNIVQMYYLDLSNNRLTDSLPASFENLTGMRYLSIANNQLSGNIPATIGFYTRGQIDSMFLHIENNRYTFKAIEPWAAMFKNYVGDFSYAPQATVPIFLQDTTAYVSVGGTASNNTYKWYKDLAPVSSKVSDSSYKFPSYGKYSAQITNSVATKLTLLTDIFNYNGLPARRITYTGSTNLCNGDSIILQVDFDPGSTYRWYKNFDLIPNASSSWYTAKTSGSYFVAVSSSAGSTTSDNVKVNVFPSISTPFITANSPLFFCAGQSTTLMSNTATGNQWYRNGILINGATNQNLFVDSSGMYTVKVSLNGCSSPPSEGFLVTVNPIPTQPTISQSGSVLKSSSLNGNQWFLNGIAIIGATDSTYNPTIPGQYSVQVTLSGCQSPMSASISYVITAINSPNLEKNLILLPNPVKNKLFITYRNNRNRITVSVMDIRGRKVMSDASFITKIELDTKLLADGIYIIRMVDTKTNEQLAKVVIKE